jgi:hypothetical protein
MFHDATNSTSIEKTNKQIALVKAAIAEIEQRYQRKCDEIEKKYGSDCLALLKKQKPEQSVKSVNKIVQVRNCDGELVSFREEYIQKRDGSLVLLRIVCLG